MIDIKDLCKYYLVGDERVRALDHATLHIYPHEFVLLFAYILQLYKRNFCGYNICNLAFDVYG